MKFSEALGMLQSGIKIAREGWASKGMYLFYIPSGTNIDFITMRSENNIDVPWMPESKDLFADDWVMPVMSIGAGFGRGISM